MGRSHLPNMGIFHQPDIGVGINSAGHFEPTGFVQKYGGWSYFFAGTALLPTMGRYHLAITVLISLCGTSTVTGSFALHCQLGELQFYQISLQGHGKQ